jgi:hypothetical protein
MATIVVLNDGETYTDISGCKIVWVDDHLEPDQIEERLKNINLAEASGEMEVITTFK